MAKDISAVGSSVVFSGGLSLTITEFSDEGTPFAAPDVNASTNAKNLNGEMISSRTPSVYPFSVTVIPGTTADEKLCAFFRKSLLQPGGIAPIGSLYCNCTISIPVIYSESGGASAARSVTFTNARAKSGPTGPSTSAQGRLSARTYSFEAEGCS